MASRKVGVRPWKVRPEIAINDLCRHVARPQARPPSGAGMLRTICRSPGCRYRLVPYQGESGKLHEAAIEGGSHSGLPSKLPNPTPRLVTLGPHPASASSGHTSSRRMCGWRQHSPGFSTSVNRVIKGVRSSTATGPDPVIDRIPMVSKRRPETPIWIERWRTES